MFDYLAGIKHLCDCLAGCGQKVLSKEQQSVVLNGLPPEYDHVVSIIRTSQTPFDLQGITTALLDAEARQSAHLTHVKFNANMVTQASITTNQVPVQPFSDSLGHQSFRSG